MKHERNAASLESVTYRQPNSSERSPNQRIYVVFWCRAVLDGLAVVVCAPVVRCIGVIVEHIDVRIGPDFCARSWRPWKVNFIVVPVLIGDIADTDDIVELATE